MQQHKALNSVRNQALTANPVLSINLANAVFANDGWEEKKRLAGGET